MTKEELGDLVIRSQDSLYRIAKTLLYNDADCADAIQDTIVKAFSHIHTLRNDAYAKTWLVRILMNECYNILRREKRLVPMEELFANSPPEEQNDYTDLYLAVSQLPEELRIAVALYYAEGFSVKEIAKLQKTTESAIKNRLFKARKMLRAILENEEVSVKQTSKTSKDAV